jgi:hypothetical protein
MAVSATTAAQAELIRFVFSKVFDSCRTDSRAARSPKTISRSSFDARSVVGWLSTRSGSHAASKRYARRVSIASISISSRDLLTVSTGQSTLPSSCPVCEHTPVAAEDCKPNKSLRTTIKVFLRTEEKKREALRLKETKNSAPATPLEVTATPVEASTPAEATEPNVAGAAETKSEPSSAPTGDQVEEPPANVGATEQAQQAEADIPQPSIEV